MPSIVFGDNQFFGVNHMSEEKARQQSIRFRETRAVLDVLDIAYDIGIKTFMCTTHDRIAEVCDHLRTDPQRYEDFRIYPCMPYAHKYADAVTEEGALGALSKFTRGSSTLGVLAKSGVAALKTDAVGLMKLLVDAEMAMFKGIKTPIVFLQNVVVDLLVGLGFRTLFAEYAAYVAAEYKAEPGFITMNLPKTLAFLEECEIDNPIICTNFNKIGFRMCGGQAEYERIIAEERLRPMAMSVFASGAIPPREALEYVCRHDRIEAIVFGASSRSNIQHTKELIEEFSGAAVV